mmetsp:Transcript_85004/g.147490  ORF Transcript_85004/g.147490 Transcript_85004/m.147490 type:complete len:82 (+) Transcript_85004:772-1017(+)
MHDTTGSMALSRWGKASAYLLHGDGLRKEQLQEGTKQHKRRAVEKTPPVSLDAVPRATVKVQADRVIQRVKVRVPLRQPVH